MSLPKELIAQELGKTVMCFLENKEIYTSVSSAAECTAVQILQEIQNVLADPDLTDFYCIEAIIEILAHSGLSTSRHDFG